MRQINFFILFLVTVTVLLLIGGSLREVGAQEPVVCKDEHNTFIEFRKDIDYVQTYSPSGDKIRPVHLKSGEYSLGGYMAKAVDANDQEVEPEGFILILPGNQIYAQNLVAEAKFLSKFGFDVYVYDYRGYGLSENAGETRVQAMMDDAKAILAHLSGKTKRVSTGYYKRKHVYGISMGAMVAINAFRDSYRLIDRVVLDGTPATASINSRLLCFFAGYCIECPPSIDPVNVSNPFGARSLMIHAENDHVMDWTQDQSQQKLLLAKARRSGVCVSEQPEFGHPFADEFTDVRLSIVANFLRWSDDNRCPVIEQVTEKGGVW